MVHMKVGGVLGKVSSWRVISDQFWEETGVELDSEDCA